MSFVLQRSAGGAHVRSLGGAKNLPYGNAMYQIIYGVVPVCGFGKFTAASNFNSLSWWAPIIIGGANYSGLVFDEQWPNVFLTLTETLTVGGASSSRIINYTQNVDNWKSISGGDYIYTYGPYTYPDPNGLFDQNSFVAPSTAQTTLSPDGTSFTQQWTGGAGLCTYTAVLSNRLDAASLWATWTAQATALLADFPFPDWNDPTLEIAPFGSTLAGMCAGWKILPYAASPGWGGDDTAGPATVDLSGEWGTLVLAAANGMAARISVADPSSFQGYASGTGMYAYSPDTPVANAWEQDSPDPGAIATTTILQNCGAVVSAKSQWNLLGLAPNYPALPGVAYNHLAGVWAQPMVLAQPPYFQRNYSKHIASFPARSTRTFAPADVIAALGAVGTGINYGILGFRPPPPLSGGAGGSITGAGGGAPAQ